MTQGTDEGLTGAAQSSRELLLRALFDHSFQYMGVLRPDGTVLDLNQSALEFSGQTREQAVGRPFWELDSFTRSPEAQAQVRAGVAVAATGDFFRCELELVSADGIDTTVDFSIQPVLDERGTVTLLLPEGRDVSELKWAERALRISEAKAAGIVSIANDAIISVDETLMVTDFNLGAERIFGYPAREVLGRPLSALLPERFRSVHDQHVRNFAEARSQARRMGERQEIMGRRKDGTEFAAEASISKLHVAGRWIFTVVLRDITERKREERAQQFLAEAGALLASSLDYETTLASVARLAVSVLADWCVIFIQGDEGSIRRLEMVHADRRRQPLLEQLRRYPLDPRRRHPVLTVLETGTTELVPQVTDALLEAISSSTEHLELWRALGLTGMLIVPLKARGRTRGAMGFFAATRTRYDARDVKLAEDLGVLAGLAVDNAVLYREARSAVQARDDMLSVVSHDLGNPLSAIRIGTSLLLRGIPPEERERGGWFHLESIRQSAEQMERLINDLLEVKRLEAGKVKLERRPTPVEPLLSSVRSTFSQLAAQKGLELVCRVSELVPPVYADRQRIAQVLSNLVGNALKFTPTGGRIVVDAVSGTTEVVFRVTDTGTGIAPEHLPHVFERFWQSRREGKQGLGLGLAICKGIVEAHGGRIWVESNAGAGTIVGFTVPAAEEV